MKDASICHSDEYEKAQTQIEKKEEGNELYFYLYKFILFFFNFSAELTQQLNTMSQM